MTEVLLQTMGICFVIAVLALLVKGTSPVLALCLSMAGILVTLGLLIGHLREWDDQLQRLSDETLLQREYLSPLLKTVAIATIARLGAELCRDSGENTMGLLMETAGVISVIWVALPLLESLWELLESLL